MTASGVGKILISKHLNAAAVTQREDVATLSSTLQKELAAKGMVLNTSHMELFRDKTMSIRDSGVRSVKAILATKVHWPIGSALG